MKNKEIQRKLPAFVIYETTENVAKVSVRLEEETVWLTQKQLAQIFDTTDDERLKNGGGRYFRELLQRIRDIRSSERNLWQQVTDIYSSNCGLRLALVKVENKR
jgi:hypothetical protein